MGARTNINLSFGEEGKINIYLHWGGEDGPKIVAQALERGRDRWDDESYLARIIISEAVKFAGINDPTGCGISPGEPVEEEYETQYINLKEQTANDRPYQKYIDYHS